MRLIYSILVLLFVEHVHAQQIASGNLLKELLGNNNVWLEQCYVRNDTLFSDNTNKYKLVAIRDFYTTTQVKPIWYCGFFKMLEVTFDNLNDLTELSFSAHYPTICVSKKMYGNTYVGQFVNSYDYDNPNENISITLYSSHMFSYTKQSEKGTVKYFMKNISSISFLFDLKEDILKL